MVRGSPPEDSHSSAAASGSKTQYSQTSCREPATTGETTDVAGVKEPLKIASMIGCRSMAIEMARRRSGSA
jgi:hypothetical protein